MTLQESPYKGIIDTLEHDLVAIEQMVNLIPSILALGVGAKAQQVTSQIQEVVELYYHESWGGESVPSTLDGVFSDLDDISFDLANRVSRLNESLAELEGIYDSYVLPQAVVLLVGSLEVYLSSLFTMYLEQRFGDENDHNVYGIIQIVRERFSFQNWGDSVKAFRNILGIEVCPPQADCSGIVRLQQKRHVFVHRLGIIDERAVKQLNLPSSVIGEHLPVAKSEILEGIRLVRSVAEHLFQSVQSRLQPRR